MKHIVLILFSALFSLCSIAREPAILNSEYPDRWSEKKVNTWYASQQWPCGFNYIPANAISYTEMWMPYCFNPELIDRELALAGHTGFNCLRVVLPFVVWEHDPAAFRKRLDDFLELCSQHGIRVMFTLFDDCAFGNDEKLKDPWYGKQPEVLEGWYANGWTPSPGHSMVRDPKTWPRLETYVKDIIETFSEDPRVWVWDLYNEPNGDLQDTSFQLVQQVFTWAREINPSQPLTIARWNGNEKLNALIFKNSDLITFHNYNNADNLAMQIEDLKQYNRPLINTEWLNRGRDSKVNTCLPVFYEQNVGCMHWGLVNGKTQTHLSWGWRPGKGEPEVWQHDLYANDHSVYDKKEIELFRKYIGLSRKKVGKGQESPNFLVLMADDMTYTDLGCYGNDEVRTPNLDRLSGEGLRFKSCFNSAPMCAPTRMSLYTGIHPVRNGAHPNHSKVYDHIKSMPYFLKELGYEVALIGKKHYRPAENFQFRYLGGRGHDNGEGMDLEIKDATSFIKKEKDHPWCLVVTSNQPHTPWNRGDTTQYDPEQLSLPTYLVDTKETRVSMTKYYAEITYMDDQMGQILRALKSTGQDKNTIVVFLSEQGSNFPHCKWTCYDTGLRSAALLRWPGVVKAGSTTDAMIQYIDILPTLIEAAGGHPEQFDFDGQSILPVLKGESDTHRKYVYGVQTSKGIHSGPDAYGIRTVRDKRYRLIRNLNWQHEFKNLVTARFEPYLSWQRKAESGDRFAEEQYKRYIIRPEFELYDLLTDPYEMTNLADKPAYKRILTELKAELEEWMVQQGDKGIETEYQALTRIAD